MTLWVSPSNLRINCQHLPWSSISPPCTLFFSQYKGPDPATLTPVCKVGALLDHVCKWHCRKVSNAGWDAPSKYNQLPLNSVVTLFQDMYISLTWLPLETKAFSHYFLPFFFFNILLILVNLRAWLFIQKTFYADLLHSRISTQAKHYSSHCCVICQSSTVSTSGENACLHILHKFMDICTHGQQIGCLWRGIEEFSDLTSGFSLDNSAFEVFLWHVSCPWPLCNKCRNYTKLKKE